MSADNIIQSFVFFFFKFLYFHYGEVQREPGGGVPLKGGSVCPLGGVSRAQPNRVIPWNSSGLRPGHREIMDSPNSLLIFAE